MAKRAEGTIGDDEWHDLQDRAHKTRRFALGSPEDVRRTIQGRDSLQAAQRGEN